MSFVLLLNKQMRKADEIKRAESSVLARDNAFNVYK